MVWKITAATFLAIAVLLFPLTGKAFTEFYVTGTATNNLNSGSTTNDGPTFHGLTGYFTNATGWWKSTGAVDLSGVSVGMWASIYTNGSTTNVCVGLITNVSDANDTIAISLAAKAGTAPSDDTAGFTQIRVGGAWKGPRTNGVNTTDNIFPFTFAANTMTNGSGPRINFKSGTYNITNSMTANKAGPIRYESYSVTAGDRLGEAIFDASGASSAIAMLNCSVSLNDFVRLSFKNNGASQNSPYSFTASANHTYLESIYITNSWRGGMSIGGQSIIVACKVENACRNNTAGQPAINDSSSSTMWIDCVSANSTNSNADGWKCSGNPKFIRCISWNNGAMGFNTIGGYMENCIAYNNGSAGIGIVGTIAANTFFRNLLIFKNGGAAITNSYSTVSTGAGMIGNWVVGSGSMTNAKGNFYQSTTTDYGGTIDVTSPLVYATDTSPWVAPDTGNFTQASDATTRSAGLQYFNNLPTTLSYPDLGPTQLASTNLNSIITGTAKPIIFLQ